MTITTNVTGKMGKTANRPQPATQAKPVGTKTVRESINVLQEPPKTATNAKNAQDPAPRQSTRRKRASSLEPSTSKTTTDWTETEEEDDTVFNRSNIIARTPTQKCCTPTDAPMAPKKKESTLAATKTRSANVTNITQSSVKNDETNNETITISSPEDIIKAMMKVRAILAENVLKPPQKDIAHKTVDMIITAMNEIFKEHHEEKHQEKQKPIEESTNTRLSNIENHLAQLTKIITESPQTYTQAVQRNTINSINNSGNPSNLSDSEIRKRIEKARQEKTKTEVILTTREANDTVKEQLANMSEEVLMKSFEDAIKTAGMKHIKIHRIQKIFNHGIKIRCATDKEAEELRSMDWKNIFEGMNTIDILHRVVIHNVFKDDTKFGEDKPEEIIRRIEGINIEKTTAKRIEPLLKHPRNPNAITQSVIISFKCPKEAEDCIKIGVHIGDRHYAITERYMPQIQLKQCFKCQAYGHKANVYIRKVKCGKCAQEHETRECQSEEMACINCKGPHCAWSHECPARQRKREQGEILRNQLSDSHTS